MSQRLRQAATILALLLLGSAVGAQELLWEARAGFRDFGPIAVVDGVVVSGPPNGDRGLVGIDAASGRILWRAKGQVASGPAGDGRHVYAAVRVDQLVHRVIALDAKTGKQLWAAEGERWGGASRVHVADGRVFVVGLDGKARAFDAATGKLLWTFTYSPGKGYCPTDIASADGRVYFGGGESAHPRSQGVNLWALDAATGQEVWHYALKPERYSRIGECVQAPAVANGIVALTGSNLILGLDAASGQVLWQQAVLGVVDGFERRRPLSAPHIADGRVYAIYEEGLAGWDLATGARVLSFAGRFPPAERIRRIESADGRLYFTANFEQPEASRNRQGFLYALDLASGKVAWSHRVNRPSQYSDPDTWPTSEFTLDRDAIYYENFQFLAKLRR